MDTLVKCGKCTNIMIILVLALGVINVNIKHVQGYPQVHFFKNVYFRQKTTTQMAL